MQNSSSPQTSAGTPEADSINNFESYYRHHMKDFERDADIQSHEHELQHAVELVSQLVDTLKHDIIIPALQKEHDWHHDHEHQIKRTKGRTGNSLLDDHAQRIAMEKGLTGEQWGRLLYLNLTAGDHLENIKVTRDHLQRVHDIALRLLENEEQETVFALIDVISKHLPDSRFIYR